MTGQWIALTALSLALAAQAPARPSGNGPERSGMSGSAPDALSPGTTGYFVAPSTGAWPDRSTSAPAGQKDPRRPDRRTVPGSTP